MKTEFSSFCDACLQNLNPLSPGLHTAVERMEQGTDAGLLHAPLATLNDVRARLRSLVEKLEGQQAYLLIFGPLKSGKSTLMNAISGSYVSEVTSLPGYPCLVFVRHSDQPHFSVTRYNGRESTFSDGSVLHDVVADSHIALAEQIRATESDGTTFDPRTHFSEAIRRVDVKIPIESLAESSTVLVDTPGLYSRMNFGYDVLTREFRDNAACAVFVVKTDNLYLEQVFNEFNQLLDLFSRIFLVINVDSGKRDLHADGSLQPSAESQNPESVVEAFKTLSMAAPLRKAYEAGRVRIHAVDLLNAASSYLSIKPGESVPEGDKQRVAFDAFQSDLTDYLNSNDYTVAFMRDCLRQGSHLCAETSSVCQGPEVEILRDQQTNLAQEMVDLDERIAAVDRLLKVDWDATFQNAREQNSRAVSEACKVHARETSKEMRAVLNRWYETADSTRDLALRGWNPLLVETARTQAEDTKIRLRTVLANRIGGAEPPSAVMTDLHLVDFDLAPVAQLAAARLGEVEATEAYQMTLRAEDVPVRKSFADWILFRGAAKVRQRVLGENLELEIDPETKAKRLPETSREALVSIIDQSINERFPTLPIKHADALLAAYVTKFREATLAGLHRLREQLVRERSDRQAPFDANAHIILGAEQLQLLAEDVHEKLMQLITPRIAAAEIAAVQDTPEMTEPPMVEPALPEPEVNEPSMDRPPVIESEMIESDAEDAEEIEAEEQTMTGNPVAPYTNGFHAARQPEPVTSEAESEEVEPQNIREFKNETETETENDEVAEQPEIRETARF